MKLSLKELPKLLKPAKAFSEKYGTFMIVIGVLVLFGFVFYRIGYFNSIEPSEEKIEEKLLTVKRPKIDKAVVEKLENLEQQNIQVQSLFNQARENPFRE